MNDPLFQVHRLNEKGMERAKAIAELFDILLEKLTPHCIGGREFSITRTKLEEACFFAKKAMASQPENQEL